MFGNSCFVILSTSETLNENVCIELTTKFSAFSVFSIWQPISGFVTSIGVACNMLNGVRYVLFRGRKKERVFIIILIYSFTNFCFLFSYVLTPAGGCRIYSSVMLVSKEEKPNFVNDAKPFSSTNISVCTIKSDATLLVLPLIRARTFHEAKLVTGNPLF